MKVEKLKRKILKLIESLKLTQLKSGDFSPMKQLYV